jgi:hypothetical protein
VAGSSLQVEGLVDVKLRGDGGEDAFPIHVHG